VDRTWFGGKLRNHIQREAEGYQGYRPAGETAVVGTNDLEANRVSAKVVTGTKAETFQEFVEERTDEGAEVYTDDNTAYVRRT